LSFGEHSFWLQNEGSDEDSLRRLLMRVDDLLPAGGGPRARGQLLLTGGGAAAAREWRVIRNDLQPIPANQLNVDVRTLRRKLAKHAPARPAIVWPHGEFRFVDWSCHSRREFPLFVDERLVEQMVDRVHPARDGDGLDWTTEITLFRVGERKCRTLKRPLPYLGLGIVKKQIDAVWLEVQMPDFEPGFDVLHAKDTTPYSGQDGQSGQVMTPDPGVPVWIGWSGRLRDPFFFAVCDRNGRPTDFIGFQMPSHFALEAKATKLALESLTANVANATELHGVGAVVINGEDASLQLRGDQVITGG
jgi:hypothetical protein